MRSNRSSINHCPLYIWKNFSKSMHYSTLVTIRAGAALVEKVFREIYTHNWNLNSTTHQNLTGLFFEKRLRPRAIVFPTQLSEIMLSLLEDRKLFRKLKIDLLATVNNNNRLKAQLQIDLHYTLEEIKSKCLPLQTIFVNREVILVHTENMPKIALVHCSYLV